MLIKAGLTMNNKYPIFLFCLKSLVRQGDRRQQVYCVSWLLTPNSDSWSQAAPCGQLAPG